MSALLLLRAVPAASLLAVANALGVQRTADDLVSHARKVLHTAATHEHHRVLLQVVADAGDVRGHLDATGEADTSALAQRRVRLLRRRRVDARADAAALSSASSAAACRRAGRRRGAEGNPSTPGSGSSRPCPRGPCGPAG